MIENTKKLSSLFLTFFKIGLFTFGGGFAMIPLMEEEIVDNHGWIDKDKFIDAISITQSVPGAVAVNLAIFFGYDFAGLTGALAATIGVALPSFIIILLIAIGFNRFSEYQFVKNIFRGIRPAVVGLIVYAAVDLGKNISWSFKLIVTMVVVFILNALFNISPIIIIFIVIFLGLTFTIRNYTGKKGSKESLNE